MKTWKIILAVAVIFLAGAALGAISANLYQRHAQEARVHAAAWSGPGGRQTIEFLHRLDRQLSLSADQYQRIERILRESQEHMKKLWDQVAPQAKENFRHTRERIRAELSPAQQKIYDELAKQKNLSPNFRDPKKDRRRPPGFGPGPRESLETTPSMLEETNARLTPMKGP